MKIAWVVLLVSALTDFVITAGSSLTTAMLAAPAMPLNNNVIIVASVMGLVAGARTIQQALKNTPETAAALKGDVK